MQSNTFLVFHVVSVHNDFNAELKNRYRFLIQFLCFLPSDNYLTLKYDTYIYNMPSCFFSDKDFNTTQK